MDVLQIDGKEIPLLEAPQHHEDPPRRILYVLFKHKQLICIIFILLIVPTFLYLLFRPTYYLAAAKVLLNPSRQFLNLSPTGGGQSTVDLAPTPEMINTEIQIIQSPELAERLAGEIPFPDDPNGKNRSAAQIRGDGQRVGGLIRAAPIRSANLIQISVSTD